MQLLLHGEHTLGTPKFNLYPNITMKISSSDVALLYCVNSLFPYFYHIALFAHCFTLFISLLPHISIALPHECLTLLLLIYCLTHSLLHFSVSLLPYCFSSLLLSFWLNHHCSFSLYWYIFFSTKNPVTSFLYYFAIIFLLVTQYLGK